MKKTIAVLLTAGLFSTVQAQEKSLLYEISGAGLSEPSYLYGTFHLLCPADLQVSGAARKAMAAAKQVYLELDLDDPSLQASMLKAMVLTGGKSLRDFMSAEDYAALDAYMQRNLGSGLASMGVLKPVAILSAMYVSLLQCQPASYDLAFAELAGKDKKDVFGLETVEEQMAVLDKIPLDKQLQSLVEIARKPDEARKEVNDLLNAYKAQDLPLLMKLMRESQFDGGTREFEDDLLDARNRAWIPLIEKAARAKSTFFAFGAAHLGGPEGVVSLLRQKGYAVKALQ